MKVAVTGGIGSGKSFVCRIFEKRGIRIYDCDSAAKRIMSSSAAVRDALTSLLGFSVYVSGRLNKAVLAKYLLASDENAKRVNGIVHPAVADDFRTSGYTWMECAILFSSGFDRLVDKVVCVTAPREIRIKRIMERDGISREKAEAWIDCQMSQDIVVARSDYEIVNDGSRELEEQIDSILNELNFKTK